MRTLFILVFESQELFFNLFISSHSLFRMCEMKSLLYSITLDNFYKFVAYS